jgi:hypothetical protein
MNAETQTQAPGKVEQFRRMLVEDMERLVATKDETKEKFMEDFLKDYSGAAESAIQWSADNVIVAEKMGQMAELVLAVSRREEDPMDPIDAYVRVRDEAVRDIMRNARHRGASRSTNQYAVVNELVILEAQGKFAELYEYYLDSVLEARANAAAAEEDPTVVEGLAEMLQFLNRQMRTLNATPEKPATKKRLADAKEEQTENIRRVLYLKADEQGVREQVVARAEELMEERTSYRR